MATKFPPEQDMENVSPKDLEEAKQYTKERKAYKDASQIVPEDYGKRLAAIFPGMDEVRANRKAAAADRASRVNEMGDAYKKGGKVSSASSRADGCATKGKTRGTMITMKNGGMC
jgi:hypothetical protein